MIFEDADLDQVQWAIYLFLNVNSWLCSFDMGGLWDLMPDSIIWFVPSNGACSATPVGVVHVPTGSIWCVFYYDCWTKYLYRLAHSFQGFIESGKTEGGYGMLSTRRMGFRYKNLSSSVLHYKFQPPSTTWIDLPSLTDGRYKNLVGTHALVVATL